MTRSLSRPAAALAVALAVATTAGAAPAAPPGVYQYVVHQARGSVEEVASAIAAAAPGAGFHEDRKGVAERVRASLEKGGSAAGEQDLERVRPQRLERGHHEVGLEPRVVLGQHADRPHPGPARALEPGGGVLDHDAAPGRQSRAAARPRGRWPGRACRGPPRRRRRPRRGSGRAPRATRTPRRCSGGGPRRPGPAASPPRAGARATPARPAAARGPARAAGAGRPAPWPRSRARSTPPRSRGRTARAGSRRCACRTSSRNRPA